MSTRTDITTKILDAALLYAMRGWRVFPVKPTSDKTPYTPHGFKDATTNVGQIRRWWARWPDANIGVSTEDMLVLDIDNKTGHHEGIRSLQDLGVDLLHTVTAMTPSGGLHQYFDGVGSCRIEMRPGLDTRGRGGFVVVPPSRDERGAYRWRKNLSPDDVERLPIPEWLGDLLAAPPIQEPSKGKKRRSAKTAVTDGPIAEGLRHSTLPPMARGVRHYGADFDDIVEHLRAVNAARCDPPLPDDEISRIAAWAAKQPAYVDEYAALEHAWIGPRSGGMAGLTDFKVMRAMIQAVRHAQTTKLGVSQRRIASLAHCEGKTVSRSLKRLVAAGNLERVGQRMRGRAIKYRVVIPTRDGGGMEGPTVGDSVEFGLRVAFGTRYTAVRVLRGLYAREGATAKEVSSDLGIPLRTVKDNLRWLCDRGLIPPSESGHWHLSGYWHMALDPEIDTDTRFTLVAFYAHNMGGLERWSKRQSRMEDQIARYDDYFRKQYGVDRLAHPSGPVDIQTGEILEGMRT